MIKLLKLDRDALQQTREDRLNELKTMINDTLTLFQSEKLDLQKLRNRYNDWKTSALQPDVADCFLAGPGQTEEPFHRFLQLMHSRE
ncbi:MAG: hypothetical protein HQM02_09455 [Magnetococcales bacterium]|nr:hypothetical protein [Magnetococcales bacterium]